VWSERLPRLTVRLVLARDLGGDAGRTAQWLEEHVNRHIDPVRRTQPNCLLPARHPTPAVGLVLGGATGSPCMVALTCATVLGSQVRDGVRVAVEGELLRGALPDTVADDWQMDAWLQSLQPSPRADAGHEYSIYLLPAGRHGALRVEDGLSLARACQGGCWCRPARQSS